MTRWIACVSLTAASFAASPAALAQSAEDFGEGGDTSDGGRRSAREAAQEVVVREIERGWYLKSAIGGTFLLGPRSAVLSSGTALWLGGGVDVVDKEKFSVAVDLSLYQAIHNSTFQDPATDLVPGQNVNTNQLIQGDVHIFAPLAGVEVSGYPVARLGLGARAGAGVAWVPLLIHRPTYESDVLTQWTVRPGVHENPLPTVYGGFTLEYYTKLSHFSLGLDVDFLYWIGFDFGLSPVAYLKYTF